MRRGFIVSVALVAGAALLVLAARWHRPMVRPAARQPAAPTPTPAAPAPPTGSPTGSPTGLPTALPPPAPRPAAPLPPPRELVLPMADGVALRAHWYAAAAAPAPVIAIDLGAGRDVAPWQPALAALVAQRPAAILWLDDTQQRAADPQLRAARALGRWRAALVWLDAHAGGARLALIGVHEGADAVWAAATAPRPLSVAALWPDEPQQPLPTAALDRFALVAVDADAAPSTALLALRNARLLRLPPPSAAGPSPQLASDLPGWLFSALGPR